MLRDDGNFVCCPNRVSGAMKNRKGKNERAVGGQEFC